MEVSFSTDLEDKLVRLAHSQGCDGETIVIEAVERLIDHDDWFAAEVNKGLAQIEAGKTFSHEEVGNRLQAQLNSKLSPA